MAGAHETGRSGSNNRNCAESRREGASLSSERPPIPLVVAGAALGLVRHVTAWLLWRTMRVPLQPGGHRVATTRVPRQPCRRPVATMRIVESRTPAAPVER
jgi:hypothetical protein